MHFRKLRVAGFKSFVEPAELLIEPGLTGLVGPNGCGKSNLLEAIRWVMGEGSARSLRGGGMEDVIFAGTARRPPRAFAEVSLLIEQRRDGGEQVEREVMRRIERGAGSAYRIDGKDVRARDVTLLFADAATGAHSPALVSQGRIAAVIAAKPQERRQMLEEAAGIAGLHVRRREAEGRLRATEENLARLAELGGETEARMASLRRQARAAARYRQLSADIRVADARALFVRWREAAAAAEQAATAARLADAAVGSAGEAQRRAVAGVAHAATTLAAARGAAAANREAAAAEAQQLDRLGRERGGIVRRLGELAAQREQIGRDRAREDALLRDASAAAARLAAEQQELAATLSALEFEREPLRGHIAEAEQQARLADVAVAALRARLTAQEAQARVVRATVAAADARVARALGEAGRIARDSAALGDEAPLVARLAAARALAREGEAAEEAATEALAEAEAARATAAAALDRAESAGASARAALAAAESEQRALTAALARPSGAPLLDSLVVTPGFERALAAALGDDLDAPLGEAGARSWAGAAPQPGDPALPDGTEPLAAFVTGVPALARRLAQVAIAAEDGGQPLAVGQRLVTPGGRMRRWDGFVAQGGGAAAAERLIRANRLAELARQLLPVRAAATEAGRAQSEAGAAQARARAAIDSARANLAGVEARLRQGRRDADAAQAQIDRRAGTLEALAFRRTGADEEVEAARSAQAEAAIALAALPDAAASQREQRDAEDAATAARRRLAEQHARLEQVDQAIARGGKRAQAARAEAAGWAARGADAAERVASFAGRVDRLEDEEAPLLARPAELERAIALQRAAAEEAGIAVRKSAEAEAAAEAEQRRGEATAQATGEALADMREARAGAAARAEHAEGRRRELSALSADRFGCPAALLAKRVGFDGLAMEPVADEAGRHERLLAERERLGAVNLVAESELAELEEGRAASLAEQAEIAEAVARLRGQVGALNREGRERLRAAFEAVDGHFRRLFATLFAGGEAHLALIDADDPLEAGLEIMAQPPGKRLGSLTLLSGGEQALTAVALVFALFLAAPAPICVLDEVDAPLDDANIDRFCTLLDAMTRETDTRYLVVTHNPVTMARMHRLFGVTMVEPGVSRLVSVDLGGAETLLAAE